MKIAIIFCVVCAFWACRATQIRCMQGMDYSTKFPEWVDNPSKFPMEERQCGEGFEQCVKARGSYKAGEDNKC